MNRSVRGKLAGQDSIKRGWPQVVQRGEHRDPENWVAVEDKRAPNALGMSRQFRRIVWTAADKNGHVARD